MTKNLQPPANNARNEAVTEAQRAFHERIDLIRRVARTVARQFAVETDAEDFTSWAILKLMERGYTVMSSYRGEAQFETYLHRVFENLRKDYLDCLYGRWRPGAVAERLGDEAVALEKLLYHDRVPVDSAVRLIVERFRISDDAAWRLVGALPVRRRRCHVTIDEASSDAALKAAPDQGFGHEAAASVSQLVGDALSSLSPDDAQLLRRRYLQGERVAKLALELGRDARGVYRHCERILKRVQKRCTGAGLEPDNVRRLLAAPVFDLKLAQALDRAESARP